MFFSKSPKLKRAEAAVIARDIAFDFLMSDNFIEDWILKSDSIIENLADAKFGCTKLPKSHVAQILRQALYFLTTRKKDISYHIDAMDDYEKAREGGVLLNFGPEIADYMDDLPYLQDFRQ